MKLAVLSDLHIGAHARCSSLRPQAGTSKAGGYTDEFISFIQSNRLKADYLILPGDIAEYAKPEEVQLASEVVIKIAEAFQIPTEKIVYVPGNHDVDWSVMDSSDTTGFKKGLRYHTIQGEKWVFNRIMRGAQGDLCNEPYFAVWKYNGLTVVGFNSAWHDDAQSKVHHGRIDHAQIRVIESWLTENPIPSADVKVFLIHHHSVPLPNPCPGEPEFSSLQNSGDFLRLLDKKKFDLLIHGHRHAPSFQTNSIDSGHPLGILCAGSFSLKLPEEWAHHVSNQFHIIDVNARDSKHLISGQVLSWSYISGRGWIQSKQGHGIRHVSPFGAYYLPLVLKEELKPHISEEIARRGHVLWRDILSSKPECKHVPAERVIQVLTEISSELGLSMLGDEPTENIILWKD